MWIVLRIQTAGKVWVKHWYSCSMGHQFACISWDCMQYEGFCNKICRLLPKRILKDNLFLMKNVLAVANNMNCGFDWNKNYWKYNVGIFMHNKIPAVQQRQSWHPLLNNQSMPNWSNKVFSWFRCLVCTTNTNHSPTYFFVLSDMILSNNVPRTS